ncbi:TetR/AcrR family transcriptional regulator [Enterovibrio calviensis]|uniref:TetR/AcrR family transcriptional regulator n=1 Tax=Enterovibrio calviensis TaxID=91359 RepID=UPI000483CEB3|nr:TetR/AcrR family transcriptional regulator [Enterovibrio calviensis]
MQSKATQERKQGRRSAETAEQTKCLIMHVAADMFAELGFERVSLRNISENAGVSHSLIRYHFGSKEQIWQAVSDGMDSYLQRYISQLLLEISDTQDSAHRIYLFLVRLNAVILCEPKPIQFIADAVRQKNDALLAYFLRSKDQFSAVFKSLFEDYNQQHPDAPVELWEMKWQMLQHAHAAISLKPMLNETWPELGGDEDALLLKHWELYNKQVAMQMGIAKKDMIHPTNLADLLLDIPCHVEPVS